MRRIRGRWRESGSLSKRAILRRVEELERVFAVGEFGDDWVDVLMWSGRNGGVFGHVCFRCSKRGETRWLPCSDEEEVEIMRGHYEDERRRLYGRGAEISFAEYLEQFSYLGSEELAVKRKLIVERLRGEEGWK